MLVLNTRSTRNPLRVQKETRACFHFEVQGRSCGLDGHILELSVYGEYFHRKGQGRWRVPGKCFGGILKLRGMTTPYNIVTELGIAFCTLRSNTVPKRLKFQQRPRMQTSKWFLSRNGSTHPDQAFILLLQGSMTSCKAS
jgi:hypothetical protein|uniref:Uncharacterized protein n=1 Tax=Mus musculus TaxID=10090 RepID=Q3UE91_MOUSE|nr:unnamed protein product [Mus musculus]